MLSRIATSLALAAGLAVGLAPSSRQSPAIAPGVRIGPVQVGGLTSEPARSTLESAFAEPVEVELEGRSWSADRSLFEVRPAVDEAVSDALAAPAGAGVSIGATWSRAAVRRFVTKLARSVDTPPREARLVGFSTRPVIRPGAPGLAVRQAAAAAALERALATPGRRPVTLPTRALPPTRTPQRFGPLIVVDRYGNSLRLYHGTTLVRRFGVATGQSIYPTPSGIFRIVDKQRNPWWYPPDSPWAAGEQPIPPGRGNPLGTRWMAISAPGVGIHGTPNDASIGYSASHGCIRMHISDAEWLFEHVRVGTPVLIR